jgi:hypothetical protein
MVTDVVYSEGAVSQVCCAPCDSYSLNSVRVRGQPIKKWCKPARGIKARRCTTNKCKTRTRSIDCQILSWSRLMQGTGTFAERAFCQPILKRGRFMKIVPTLQFKLHIYSTCILQCICNCHYKAILTFCAQLLNDTQNAVLWQITTLNYKGQNNIDSSSWLKLLFLAPRHIQGCW